MSELVHHFQWNFIIQSNHELASNILNFNNMLIVTYLAIF